MYFYYHPSNQQIREEIEREMDEKLFQDLINGKPNIDPYSPYRLVSITEL